MGNGEKADAETPSSSVEVRPQRLEHPDAHILQGHDRPRRGQRLWPNDDSIFQERALWEKSAWFQETVARTGPRLVAKRGSYKLRRFPRGFHHAGLGDVGQGFSRLKTAIAESAEGDTDASGSVPSKEGCID